MYLFTGIRILHMYILKLNLGYYVIVRRLTMPHDEWMQDLAATQNEYRRARNLSYSFRLCCVFEKPVGVEYIKTTASHMRSVYCVSIKRMAGV